MTQPHSPDQLRWQITPILALALDAAERTVIELYGHRTIVPHATALAEAIRQLQAAQRGEKQGDDPALLAFIAGQAAMARHDLVRQHIADAAARTFGPRAGSDQLIARDIADAAMKGMGPLFTQSVTSAADTVLSMVTDHPDWRYVVKARAAAQADAKIAELLSFVERIAGMHKDGEPGDDSEPYDMVVQLSVGDWNAMIGEARHILGTPDPADGEPVAPEQRWRWTDHNRPNGNWCRWSKVSAPADRAGIDDQRCPFDCPDSAIEADPNSEQRQAQQPEPSSSTPEPVMALSGAGSATCESD